MDLFLDMALFHRIVASGSLSAAGRELGLSPGAVSQRLKGLEQRCGVPLLTRSSRAVALTDEGEIFLEAAKSILEETEALSAALARKGRGLSGRLRIAAPADLGRQAIEPLVLAFQAEHADLSIEFHVSDALEDVIARDVDVAFRYGNLRDSSLVTRRLASNRRVVVAAPGYLEAFGTPLTPDDLGRHDCLLLSRDSEKIDRWAFRVAGEEVLFRVRGGLVVNDGELLRRWALAGHGLALKSYLDVQRDLAAGRLVEVLTDYAPAEVPLQLLYSAARRKTPRIRDFVAAAVLHFRQWQTQNES